MIKQNDNKLIEILMSAKILNIYQENLVSNLSNNSVLSVKIDTFHTISKTDFRFNQIL